MSGMVVEVRRRKWEGREWKKRARKKERKSERERERERE